MKQLKLIMLFSIGVLFIASRSFGQANPFINVLPSNSGIVSVGATIDIEVTIGNTGPVSPVPQAKLRPIIQVPPSVTFLPTAQQTGLPVGWTILSNTGSQLRVCNSTDPISINTTRTITLKVQGVTVTGPQTFSGNINFGNGTTCAAGPTVTGDVTTDNSALSTIEVKPKLNLTAYIQGYYGSANAAVGEMAPVLNNAEMAGEPTIVGSTLTQCDTITVQLRDDTTYAVAYTFKGILNTNGTMSCTFPGAALGNSYYIALQHRNALETWSASPVLISPTSTYNFSTSASQAYNDNQIEVATGKFAIYSGDIERVNGPGVLDFDDSNIWESDYNNFGAMYISTDLNGDGTIDFLDINIWESNYNNFISVQKP